MAFFFERKLLIWKQSNSFVKVLNMSLDALRWALSVTDNITSTQKFVLVSLADRADENHRCFPSVRRICKDTILAERAVRNALRSLEESGYIEVIKKDGKVNIYRLIGVPDRHSDPGTSCTPASNAPLHQVPNTPAFNAPHPGTSCRTPRHQVPPNLLYNLSINQSGNLDSDKPPKKRATVPKDLEISETHRKIAAEKGVNVEYEKQRWLSRCEAKGTTYLNHAAGFRSWLLSPYCKPVEVTNGKRTATDAYRAGYEYLQAIGNQYEQQSEGIGIEDNSQQEDIIDI